MKKNRHKPANIQQAKLKKGSSGRERRPKGAQKPVQPQSLLFSNPKFLYCVVIITIIIFLSHWPALTAKALSVDDEQYLIKNELVQHPGWSSTGRFLTEVFKPSTVSGYYQPLSMISLMIDCGIGGKTSDTPTFNLAVFHGTSLILHIINVILIMCILYILFGNLWVAAGISLLFGIHPMTIEPVTWITERKTLLAAFFTLGSLTFYLVYVRKSGKKFYWAALVSYVLALMSKPTSTALPLIILLLDYWPLQRLRLNTFLEKVPFLIIGFLSAVITYISQSNTAKTVVYSIGQFILMVCHNLIFYLSKFLWPVNLSSFYPFPKPFDLSNTMVLAGVIGACLLTLVIIISIRWTKALMVGSLFFLLALFPTMGGIGFNNVIAADKYTYLPLVGLLISLGWFFTWLWGHAPQFLKQMPAKVGLTILILMIFLAEIGMTRNYLAYWRNSETLTRYMVSHAPQSSFLQNQFGLVLSDENKYEEAILHYQEAIQLQPNFGEAYNNLGVALLNLKRYDEALGYFKEAVRLQPGLYKTYNNIGNILVYQGKYDEAIQMYRKSLEIQPFYANTHKYLGKAFMAQGKFNEATNEFQEALRINPYLNDVQQYLNELPAQPK
jgi:Flp pilus assembly protein TadD